MLQNALSTGQSFTKVATFAVSEDYARWFYSMAYEKQIFGYSEHCCSVLVPGPHSTPQSRSAQRPVEDHAEQGGQVGPAGEEVAAGLSRMSQTCLELCA